VNTLYSLDKQTNRGMNKGGSLPLGVNFSPGVGHLDPWGHKNKILASVMFGLDKKSIYQVDGVAAAAAVCRNS
jgi:hypothetical protein